jgi:hypothetical protein
MAKFIQIPTTVAGSPNILFNTDNISSVSFLTATTFAIYAGSTSFTFTTSAAGAAGTVSAVYKAILATNGPTLVDVVMPTGVTIGALPVVATIA